jgi:signal transduction histidine kinase
MGEGATRSTDGADGERGDLGSLGTSDRHTAARRKARRRAQSLAEPPSGQPPRVKGFPTVDDAAAAEHSEQTRELAHDLSEGLGTIGLFAGALELHLGRDLDPVAARDLDGIRAGLERMSTLVSATLGANADFAPGDGHRPVDTNVVVRDALANVEARAAHADAQIVCEPLPWVLGDAAGLTRLFQNLLANAIEYRHPARAARVRIGARPQQSGWLFEVADNGRGIAPEVAARAFDSARPDPGDRHHPSRGLGLGICAGIVAAHGGQARAASRPEGGTIVSFELPRVTRSGSQRP